MGEFTQRTRVIAPEGPKLIEDEKTSFKLNDLRAKHRIVARFNNLLFRAPGEYSVEVLLNGELKVRYPLIIEKIKPK